MDARQLLRRRWRGREEGVAMITAIFMSVVMVAIPIAMLQANMGQLPLSRYDQDRVTALAAAEAGVQDYLNRLNHNPNYWTYNSGNLPPDGNQAFTSFVPVSNQSSGQFEYSPDASQFGATGIVYLTSTGQSRQVTRTIRVGLREAGFLDNLEMTNYNLVDPVLDPVVNNSVSTTTTDCVYKWQDHNPTTGGTGPNMGLCGGLINYWITGNVANGPLRSNDNFYFCGTPTLVDLVTTGDTNAKDSPYWHDPAGCSGDAPNFEQKYSSTQAIEPGGTITFPPSDTSISTYGNNGGCLYTGPTSIVISGSNMTVLSPDTQVTNSGCYNTSSLAERETPQTVPIPSDGVVYVQTIPTSGANSGPCVFTVSWETDSCGAGDAFVQGTLSSQLTIASDNNIYITGDTTYNNFTGNTVLGLITQNFVLVNHPIDGNGNTVVGTVSFCSVCAHPVTYDAPADYVPGGSSCSGGTSYNSTNPPQCNVTVDAAILSVAHSLGTANFTRGGVLGTLNIDGAISGQFMDIEGVFGGNGNLVDGYNENYTYDTRLSHLTPPYFLNPSETTWHSISFEECHIQGSGC